MGDGSGGMTPHDVLRVATIYGAEAIGMNRDIGSVSRQAGRHRGLDKNPLTISEHEHHLVR
jgi:hypothetical protein